jgi:hypothetical protein
MKRRFSADAAPAHRTTAAPRTDVSERCRIMAASLLSSVFSVDGDGPLWPDAGT